MSYGKVHDSYLDGEKIKPVSDRAAFLGLYLIYGRHRNAIGCFRLGIGALTDVPRFGKWGIEGVSQALQELCGTGFLVWDQDAGWMLITNALVKDPIKGVKAAIHAAKLAADIPENSTVYPRLKEILSPQLETELEGQKNVAGWPMRPASIGDRTATDTPSIPLRSPDPYPQPEPAPQPSPAAVTALLQDDAEAGRPPTADAEIEAARREAAQRCAIGDRIVELCGGRGATARFDYGVISSWLAAGYDAELDIYPTVQRLAARSGFKLKSLGYFTEAIGETWRARTTPTAAPAVAPRPPTAAPRPARPDAGRQRAEIAEDFERRFGKVIGGPLPTQKAKDDPLDLGPFDGRAEQLATRGKPSGEAA